LSFVSFSNYVSSKTIIEASAHGGRDICGHHAATVSTLSVCVIKLTVNCLGYVV